jgi:valyl-tRNA synthetase
LGWPDDTPDLRAFYPTTLLVTGFDIIFFWCARMIMFGMEMMGDVPFRQVHIHGLVRDAERVKMSKTKGNVIDPLVINEKYGTDAVRFGLLVSAAPGNDIALSEDRIDAEKAFANKIWNASRLLFSKPREGAGKPVSLADQWIGNQLSFCAEHANRAFGQHRYHEAAKELYHFWWDDFCDWYLEFKKVESDWSYAYVVYEKALRLLHPLMPFITEELWQRLGLPGKSISLATYPQFEPDARNPDAANEMQIIQAAVTEIRQMRAANKVANNQLLTAEWKAPGSVYARAVANQEAISRMASVTLTIVQGAESPYALRLNIPVDRARLTKENEQLEKQIAAFENQFSNEEFLAKAPEKVVAAMRAKRAEYEKKLAENLAALAG